MTHPASTLRFREVQRFPPWLVLVATLVGVGLLIILLGSSLRTDVHDDAVYVRYFPFHAKPRRLPYGDIQSCAARTYDPIREYGGWGLRGSAHDRAWNMRGKQGVQLVFHDGTRLLLGSQHAETLADAINAAKAGAGGAPFIEVQRHAAWWVWLVSILVLAPATALFWALKLEIEVRQDGLHARLFPLHVRFRRFPFDTIQSATARTYRPIRDYGGWGLRGLGRDRAWNMSGNHGVQLVFHDGRRLLLGSQQAGELAAALTEGLRSWGGS